MSVGVRLFVSSATFGGSIALVYWLVAREPAGMWLLSIMGAALGFVAGYATVAERHADLAGDDPHARYSAVEIGRFTQRSIWPPLAALGACALLLGLTQWPVVAGFGLVMLGVAIGALVAESR